MRKADVTLVRDNRPSITDKFTNIRFLALSKIHFKTHFVPSAFLSFLLKIIRSTLSLCRVTIRKNNNLSVVAFGLVNVIRFDFLRLYVVDRVISPSSFRRFIISGIVREILFMVFMDKYTERRSARTSKNL